MKKQDIEKSRDLLASSIRSAALMVGKKEIYVEDLSKVYMKAFCQPLDDAIKSVGFKNILNVADHRTSSFCVEDLENGRQRVYINEPPRNEPSKQTKTGLGSVDDHTNALFDVVSTGSSSDSDIVSVKEKPIAAVPSNNQIYDESSSSGSSGYIKVPIPKKNVPTVSKLPIPKKNVPAVRKVPPVQHYSDSSISSFELFPRSFKKKASAPINSQSSPLNSSRRPEGMIKEEPISKQEVLTVSSKKTAAKKSPIRRVSTSSSDLYVSCSPPAIQATKEPVTKHVVSPAIQVENKPAAQNLVPPTIQAENKSNTQQVEKEPAKVIEKPITQHRSFELDRKNPSVVTQNWEDLFHLEIGRTISKSPETSQELVRMIPVFKDIMKAVVSQLGHSTAMIVHLIILLIGLIVIYIVVVYIW